MRVIGSIYVSNLSNTNIPLDFDSNIQTFSSEFKGNDYSNITIDANEISNKQGVDTIFSNSFRNTQDAYNF